MTLKEFLDKYDLRICLDYMDKSYSANLKSDVLTNVTVVIVTEDGHNFVRAKDERSPMEAIEKILAIIRGQKIKDLRGHEFECPHDITIA